MSIAAVLHGIAGAPIAVRQVLPPWLSVDVDGGKCVRTERAERHFRPHLTAFCFRAVEVPRKCLQCGSIRCTERLMGPSIEFSVFSAGDGFANARAVTIAGPYKAEIMLRRKPQQSFEPAEFAMLIWIVWFNNHLLLDIIGIISPGEAEERYRTMLDGQMPVM
jgi:hypothetical protein